RRPPARPSSGQACWPARAGVRLSYAAAVPCADPADHAHGSRLYVWSRAKSSNSVSAATESCPSSITPRSLPTWARAGFQPPTFPMPYVVGDRGDIVAILWADHDPLHAPPLAQRNNKILWISKIIPGGPFTP